MAKRVERTFGWVQNPGKSSNLKITVKIFKKDTDVNINLRTVKIPKLVSEEFGKSRFIEFLENEGKIEIPYTDLKGKGVPKGMSRGTSPCSGIVQAAIHSQGDKEYTDDWTADGFLRWGISLGFIDYDKQKDSCSISELGLRFIETDDESAQEKEVLGEAYLSYPPAVRVLNLLDEGGHLTKFEIGRKLGFKGEAGFTSIPQNIYVHGYCTATKSEKSEIRQDVEGSSDKYARMIAGWLCDIGWVTRVPKEVIENYAGLSYKTTIGQSYVITLAGQRALKSSKGISSKRKIAKIVYWEMLASKSVDKNYLRNKRTIIIHCINKREKTLDEIVEHLKSKGYDETNSSVLDDIHNFENIGLTVKVNKDKFTITDNIEKLNMPIIPLKASKSDVSKIKDKLRDRLNAVDHKYLALIDLSFDGKSDRDFEIQTIDLLVNELDFMGNHLGGVSKPDGVIYYNNNGVIIDNKAYSKGYPLPGSQADEMIRYIEENKQRGDINANKWWENFDVNVDKFNYLFISSDFVGGFEDRLKYIAKRTGVNGGAINSQNLLLFAEEVKSSRLSYSDSFNLFNNNNEIQMNV